MGSPPISLGAQLLKEWRLSSGLSQTKACIVLGIDQSIYSKWEVGARKPGRSHAVTVEQRTAGHVPVAAWDLHGDEDVPAEDAPADESQAEEPGRGAA